MCELVTDSFGLTQRNLLWLFKPTGAIKLVINRFQTFKLELQLIYFFQKGRTVLLFDEQAFPDANQWWQTVTSLLR